MEVDNWQTKNIEKSSCPELDAFPPLFKRLMIAKGINSPDKIQEFLYPKLNNLKNPFSLFGMDNAVERLKQAFERSEKVCIYADFDLDGTSGLALLKWGLEKLGFKDLIYYQPRRLSEGYGFHVAAVEDLAAQGAKLIVTVDVGITSLAAAQKAKDLGIDVILTDHHLPGQELPQAFVIVNPNQGADHSGLNYLCGAGVAFYLLRALKRHLLEAGHKVELDFRDVLEFFTIATLTDMVPLVKDNRILVKLGLQALEQTQKPGLRYLLEKLDLSGRPLSGQDVAIRFAPKLNALSRMESEILPIDLFLCDSDQKAREMMGYVLSNNQTRVQLQSDAEALAHEMVKNQLEQDFIFVSSEKFHRGVLGLIATKLSQQYNKPSFVGAIDLEENKVTGSARLPAQTQLSLVEALTSAAPFLSRFGGHMAAAGFEYHCQQHENIAKSLYDFFSDLKYKPTLVPQFYDVEAKLSEVTPLFMKWYEFLGPYGNSFELPVFLFNKVIVEGIKELRGGHYRLQLRSEDKISSANALLFSPTPQQQEILSLGGPSSYDILGEVQWNYFNGQKAIQIIVKDIRISVWQ